MHGERYTCEHCGGEFAEGWSEADVIKEYEDAFTQEERAETMELPARVCDDCYKILMQPRIPKPLNERMDLIAAMYGGRDPQVEELIGEIRQLRADLEWLAKQDGEDRLYVNDDGMHYWCYDHTNTEYATIAEAIAAKRGAEVKR